jgi:hypothetical protein
MSFDPSKFVTVRLTVESLRHQIVHAMTGIEGEITAEVERQLDAEMKVFDFAALVKDTLRRELHDTVRRHIEAAFSKLRFDSAVREGVVRQIVAEMRSGLAADEIAELRSTVDFLSRK